MYETKTCPQCGAQMFSDMDVCYECLHGYCEDGEQVPEEAYADIAAHVEEAEGAWCLRISTSVVDVTVGVPDRGLVIGRGTSCDVVLHAQAVSRRHVSIDNEGRRLVAHDLGATNRATVNGKAVGKASVLNAGDVLEVCGTTMRVGRVAQKHH